MKKQMTWRITALVLALVLLLPSIAVPTFAEESPMIYENGFEAYSDPAADLNALKDRDFKITASTLTPVDIDGNTALKIEMKADIVGTIYDCDYYIYTDNYLNWTSHEDTKNFEFVSYDIESATLVVLDKSAEPAVERSFQAEKATDEEISNGLYGRISPEIYGGSTTSTDGYKWIIASGEYTACVRMGDTKNLDRCNNVILPQISYETHRMVYLSADYYIPTGATGKMQSQITNYTSNGVSGSWMDLFTMDLGAGTLDTCGSDYAMSKDEWHTVGIIIDLVNGIAVYYIDGVMIRDLSLGKGNLAFESWSVAKIFKQLPTAFSGEFYFDNVRVYPMSAIGDVAPFRTVTEDFESYVVNETVYDNLITVQMHSGSKVGRIDCSVVNQNPCLLHPTAMSYMSDYIVFEADYYIPSSTKGCFQAQIYKFDDTNGTTHYWQDMYQIFVDDTYQCVRREGGNPDQGYQIPLGEWFTVSFVLDPSTGVYNVFVNGVLAVAYQGIRSYPTPLNGISKNNVVFGKVNTPDNGVSAEGEFFIDNISFRSDSMKNIATQESTWSYSVDNEDIWDFEFTPLDLYEFITAGPYSYPSTTAYSKEGYNGSDAVRVDFASVIEDGVETNIDKMLRPIHDGYCMDLYKTVVLKARYCLSEDARGVVESQLYDTNGWRTLFTIDAGGETVNGAKIKRGEWFTVSAEITLATGATKLFLNDTTYIGSTYVVENSLMGNEWSVLKIKKDCAEYAGYVLVDDMSIDGNATIDAFAGVDLEGALTAVEGASIRLKEPTGLRFATRIDAEKIEAIANTYSYVNVGTLIAPASYVEQAGAFTKEVLSKLNYVTSYVEIPAEIGNYYGGNELGEGTFMVGSIVNILDQNISREFVSIGYVEYVINGQLYTVYATRDADVDYARSVQEVAKLALETDADRYTADEIEILEGYAY